MCRFFIPDASPLLAYLLHMTPALVTTNIFLILHAPIKILPISSATTSYYNNTDKPITPLSSALSHPAGSLAWAPKIPLQNQILQPTRPPKLSRASLALPPKLLT